MNGEVKIISCSCCGAGITDTPEENVNYGIIPSPDDTGFGMCRECGGDQSSEDPKKKIGWAACCFYEARFDVVRSGLSEANQYKWDNLSYERKAYIVMRFVEKGVIF